MDPIDPEQLDLPGLVKNLIGDLGNTSMIGYVVGKTAIRNAIADHLHCSMLESEELTDTLVLQGYARFVGDPGANAPGYWVLQPRAVVF